MRRERSLGRPIELLHLALHASPAGVDFADGMADGSWLSERLFGVRIVILASCGGDSIGDWLGVVPHVITLSEDISHEDAVVLTQHFWHNIGLSLDPGAALDEALTHCRSACVRCQLVERRPIGGRNLTGGCDAFELAGVGASP